MGSTKQLLNLWCIVYIISAPGGWGHGSVVFIYIHRLGRFFFLFFLIGGKGGQTLNFDMLFFFFLGGGGGVGDADEDCQVYFCGVMVKINWATSFVFILGSGF